jgi:hypothetical protein
VLVQLPNTRILVIPRADACALTSRTLKALCVTRYLGVTANLYCIVWPRFEAHCLIVVSSLTVLLLQLPNNSGNMRYTSFVLIAASLLQAGAQFHNCSATQPTVNTSHQNPWMALSEVELAGVNDLLQQEFSLTGNQGSR